MGTIGTTRSSSLDVCIYTAGSVNVKDSLNKGYNTFNISVKNEFYGPVGTTVIFQKYNNLHITVGTKESLLP